MQHFNFTSTIGPSKPKVDLASVVHRIVLAASLGAALMSVGVSPAQAATNVAIKNFEGAWSSIFFDSE